MGNILDKLKKDFLAVYMRDGCYKVVCECNGTGYIINLDSIFICRRDKMPLTANEILEIEEDNEKKSQISTILVACLNRHGEMNYFTSKNQKFLIKQYAKFKKDIKK